MLQQLSKKPWHSFSLSSAHIFAKSSFGLPFLCLKKRHFPCHHPFFLIVFPSSRTFSLFPAEEKCNTQPKLSQARIGWREPACVVASTGTLNKLERCCVRKKTDLLSEYISRIYGPNKSDTSQWQVVDWNQNYDKETQEWYFNRLVISPKLIVKKDWHKQEHNHPWQSMTMQPRLGHALLGLLSSSWHHMVRCSIARCLFWKGFWKPSTH